MPVQTRRPQIRKAKPPRGARPGFGRRVARAALLGVLVFYAVFGAAFFYLRWLPPLTTAVQAQRRVEALIGRKPYEKKQKRVPLRGISPDLQHAVIAAEDARFYEHRGIDWKQVSKVAEVGLEEGEIPRGASTITQQLIKNLFLGTWRNPVRKTVEWALVPPAELILGKQRILELYLNVIEWGPGVYGAESAARHYYRTSAAKVSREQAIRLAAVIPLPLRRRPERMNRYSAVIHTRMRQMGW